MPNMKKVKQASEAIGAKLKAIEDDEKERNRLRKLRDDLNEQISEVTQRMTASRDELQAAVADLDRGMKEA